MIMKSLSGSTGALDKALPRDRRAKTDSTRESSRSEGDPADGSDLVASLQADCRGAWTQFEPAAPGCGHDGPSQNA